MPRDALWCNQMTNTSLIGQIHDWVFMRALPLWGTVGLDRRHGGYFEKLSLAGDPIETPFKRTRVSARQIYVFSHAAILGWTEGEACAGHGLQFLKKAWRPDGGWARRLTLEGKPLDDTLDLYDHAFVLFSLAWHHRAFRDPESVTLAHATLDAIEQKMRPQSGPGFLHEVPAVGWRQQNPHMHLLEAAIAWMETTSDPRFAALASELVALFQSTLFDRQVGVLGEFFDEAWRPAPDAKGQITEPGHQFEWAWILAQYQKLTGVCLDSDIRRLVATAEAHGVDRAGAIWNQVGRDRKPIDFGSRLWPNCERIKAYLALYEVFGDKDATAAAQSINRLLQNYLAQVAPGGWIDTFDAQGNPTSADMPASSLYHLFLAFSEVLRLRKAFEPR